MDATKATISAQDIRELHHTPDRDELSTKMSPELAVAFIALIVSLIALFIALGQLLGQMFATADGYRRCQDSVIGPWASKTRLVWHWSQFRFETKFTTPEIVLYDERSSDKTSSLGMSLGLKRRYTMRNVVDLKQAQIPMETLGPYQANEDKLTNNDAVTWLAFLQQLRYQENARRFDLGSVRAQSGMKVGIIHRERTWDLMPPDVSLPVASSRLGVIVALALRLGMSWENLDLSNGLLRATGNGHTLISTTIRGLGVTFQYTFNDDLGSMQNALLSVQSAMTSETTDLIRCGIVPGCSKLGIEPIPLAGESEYEVSKYLKVGLQRLGVAEHTINHMTQPHYLRTYQGCSAATDISLAINDMIVLCSEPWPDLDILPWPIQTDVPFCSFLFWELRERYFSELNQRSLQASASDHIKSLAEKMRNLRTDYEDDFLCRWGKAVITNPITTASTRKRFLADLIELHTWTTVYFQNLQHVAPYRFFVALHVMLILDGARWSFPQQWGRGNPERWEGIVAYCVRELPNLHISTVPYISATGGPGLVPANVMEEAWWTLILRGISWKMMHDHSTHEKPIPSKFYFDQTPVYIM